MKKELDEALCRDFPNLYSDRSRHMNQSAMFWGFQCGDGWYGLLRRLSEKLEPLVAAQPLVCYWCNYLASEHPICEDNEFSEDGKFRCDKTEFVLPCRASTVKEKFGTLRFYLTAESDEMSKAIAIAEAESAITCEACGEKGEIRGGGWLVTLCDACDTSYNKDGE